MSERVMLAADCDGKLERIRLPVLASFKLDGIRAWRSDKQLLSRTAKPIPNRYTSRRIIECTPDGFDGEIIVGSPRGEGVFARSVSGVMTREGEPSFTYWVLDYVIDDTTAFMARQLDYTRTIHESMPSSELLRAIPQKFISRYDELEQYESECVDAGFEGIITRDPNGLYKRGRSTMREQGMVKVKRFADAEATIIGATEMMRNQNAAKINAQGYMERSSHQENKTPAGMLGTWILRDSEGVEFEVGTGFTESERIEFWETWLKRPQELQGRLVTYKHFPYGRKDKPRLPSWKGFCKDR